MKKRTLIRIDKPLYETREGEKYLGKGNLEKAKHFFNKALSYDPKYESAIIHLASIAVKKEEFIDAAKLFEKISEIAIEKHLFVKAAAALKRALYYDPTNLLYIQKLKTIVHSKTFEQDIKLEEATPAILEDATLPSNPQSPLKIEQVDSEVIEELNLADLNEDEIDLIAEIEVMISEGNFVDAEKILLPLMLDYPKNPYIKQLAENIKSKERCNKSFVISDSEDPEIDFSGAIK